MGHWTISFNVSVPFELSIVMDCFGESAELSEFEGAIWAEDGVLMGILLGDEDGAMLT